MAKKKFSLPTTGLVASYKPSKEDMERERRYRAESDIRTLRDADEIRKDRDRMGACKQHIQEQVKALK